MTDWEKVDNKVPLFSLEGRAFDGKVVDVYDGDTVKICFSIFNEMFRWNCRIQGVDTPELRTKDLNEKKMGYEVRDTLRNLILNRVVTVVCGEFDKYGRLLVDITTKEQVNVTKWLIESGRAHAYDGGTKKGWKTDDGNNS